MEGRPPAPLRRSHEAKVAGKSEVVVWGRRIARRELLYVDDVADAMVFSMAAKGVEYASK
jgi:GDP-L-fucose synthase